MKTITFLILLLVSCVPAFASDDNPPNEYHLKKTAPTDPIRPKKPAKSVITFTYDNGVCYFGNLGDIEFLDVTFTQNSSGFAFFAECSQSDPTIELTLPGGEYLLTCVTDDGQVYEGLVYVY